MPCVVGEWNHGAAGLSRGLHTWSNVRVTPESRHRLRVQPYIQASARELANQAGVREWVGAHAKNKWLWAGHVRRRPASSWLWRVSSWRDSEWNELCKDDGCARPLRPSRRRWMKWEDSLRRFACSHFGSTWTSLCADRAKWTAAADAFAQCFSRVDAATV